jgi:hypothetical protein
MINPFTYSFFGPTLDYFICPDLSLYAHSVQIIYSLTFILVIGPLLMYLVISLDDRAFVKIFKKRYITHEKMD